MDRASTLDTTGLHGVNPRASEVVTIIGWLSIIEIAYFGHRHVSRLAYQALFVGCLNVLVHMDDVEPTAANWKSTE